MRERTNERETKKAKRETKRNKKTKTVEKYREPMFIVCPSLCRGHYK